LPSSKKTQVHLPHADNEPTPFYWTRSAVTDERLASSKGRRGLTRAVAGAILAPHETQRQVVSGKTGSQWCPTQIGDGFACLLNRTAKWWRLMK